MEEDQSPGAAFGCGQSRGIILCGWLRRRKKILCFEDYDCLLEIAAEHELVLSLGDGLRPGGIADVMDRGHIAPGTASFRRAHPARLLIWRSGDDRKAQDMSRLIGSKLKPISF